MEIICWTTAQGGCRRNELSGLVTRFEIARGEWFTYQSACRPRAKLFGLRSVFQSSEA